MSYLLDACALLAFINKETGWTVVVGTASVLGFTLVTADHHELDHVEQNETISFHWIRPRL